VPEEVKCDGPAHVSGAADDGEGLPVVHSGGPGPGARGDRGFRDGVVGEDGTRERGMRVVISARVADGARVEPALGPRLEDPSPGRRSVGAWATRSAVDGRSRGTEDAREEWKFPMVTWEVGGDSL
jgi:hypothetical protein